MTSQEAYEKFKALKMEFERLDLEQVESRDYSAEAVRARTEAHNASEHAWRDYQQAMQEENAARLLAYEEGCERRHREHQCRDREDAQNANRREQDYLEATRQRHSQLIDILSEIRDAIRGRK